jgi:hypothetical protein
MKKILYVFIFTGIFTAFPAIAHQPNIAGVGDIVVTDPEISKAYYGELRGAPQKYIIESPEKFVLYLNILVPKNTNPDGRYSARIYDVRDGGRVEMEILRADLAEWKEFYEEYGRDYYYMGPEFEKQLLPGHYEVEVFNEKNEGRYVLAVGKAESFPLPVILKTALILPWLKIGFFGESPLEILSSPFVFGPLIGLIVLISAVVGAVVWRRKKRV